MGKESQPENIEYLRLDWRLTGCGEIPYKVSQGMFATEKLVTITAVEETQLSFFAENSKVEFEKAPKRGEKIEGWVIVQVKTEKENSLMVVLPGEPFNSGEITEIPKEVIRGIKVPKNLIWSA